MMKAMGRRSIASFLTLVLTMVWWLMAIGLVAATLLLVLSPFVKSPIEVDASWLAAGSNSTMTIPVSVAVDARTHPVAAPALGIKEAQLENLHGSLRFPTRHGPIVTGHAILLMLLFALGLWVVGQLRAVFRTLRAGRPFVPANATRLRRVAYGVIAAEIARAAVVLFEHQYARTHFSAPGLRFEVQPDLSVVTIVYGLIILVIAEVFRAGTRLDEEQSLTV
jgi:hypothetical protein